MGIRKEILGVYRMKYKYQYSGLWHVHTSVTDGKNSPVELLQFAEDNGFPLVVFTEHVRENPSYDFIEFYNDIKNKAIEFDIQTAVGVETKVIDRHANLDISKKVFEKADVVLGAFHGSEFGKDQYLESANNLIEREMIDIWAHPLHYPIVNNFSLSEDVVNNICRTLRGSNILYEVNLQRPPCYPCLNHLHVTDLVVGYDIHDLSKWR